MTTTHRLLLVSYLLVGLGLGSCGTTESSRFYVLASVRRSEPDPKTKVGPKVRLVTVELPKHLDSARIVTRTGENRLEFAEYDRWASSLQDLFSATLTANLGAMLPSEHVVRFPWEPMTDLEHLVTVSVTRFEVQDATATLAARWGILDPGGKTRVVHESWFARPARREHPEDYAEVVDALSACLADLSREIAKAILAAPR